MGQLALSIDTMALELDDLQLYLFKVINTATKYFKNGDRYYESVMGSIEVK